MGVSGDLYEKSKKSEYAIVNGIEYELIYIRSFNEISIKINEQLAYIPEGFTKLKDDIYIKDIKKEEIQYAFNCRTYCMFSGIRCWVNSELEDGRVWLMALIDIRNKEEVEKVLKLGFKKDETGDPRDPGTYSGAFDKELLSEFIYEKKAIPGLPFKEE